MLSILLYTILPIAVAGLVLEMAFSDQVSSFITGVPSETMTRPAPAPQVETTPVKALPKPTLGDRGATPKHYRAFSLLQTRTDGARFDDALFSFRLNAKRIKLEEDEAIRAEALRLMDSFVLLAEEFAPLSDNLAGAELKAVKDAMRDTVLRLDASLDAILDGSERSTDGFRTAVRFIETRYADEAPNPLSSI